jgi:acetyl-CoA carboxylase carboxyltransferase component
MVTGEKTTLEAMGGARVHTAESGVGHFLCKTEQEALDTVRTYLSYLPSNWQHHPPAMPAKEPAGLDLAALVPVSERQAFDMRKYVKGLVDEGSFFEIQALWARELTVGFARLNGEVVGVLGNNSMFKGGVLFVDSAKMITAVSEATVPKICVVVRKAYGAGLYAMAGPGFDPDATIALPTAKIAVMGAEAAVNAVYANKIAALGSDEERAAFVAERRAEYERDIDIMRLASELVVDAVVEPADLRTEIVRRLAAARGKDRGFSRRRHGVTPV